MIPGIENRDVKYETFIKEKHPELVEKGWVSVYTKICSPNFTENDKTIMPGFPGGRGACSTTIIEENKDSKNQVNLITPIQGETMYGKFDNTDVGVEIFDYLRPVFSAAVALIPDRGEWLVNMDLHGGNILTNKNTGLGMMSDWDQSLILTPNNIIDQINQQIVDNDPCLQGESTDFSAKYPQWWSRAINAIKSCKQTESLSREEVNTLRVWTIRTIFLHALRYSEIVRETFNSKKIQIELLGKVKNETIKKTTSGNMALLGQVLIECNTQSEISNTIQRMVELLGGGGLSQLVGGKTRRRRLKKN